MEYEYKSFLLVSEHTSLNGAHSEILNNYFNEGWEYVDTITQSISTGGNYSTKRGATLVILKKKLLKL